MKIIKFFRASATDVNLFGNKFSDFLTKSDQIIPGNVTIHGNLIVNNIQIDNIRTNNKICKYDIGAMIDDTIQTNTDAINAVITGEKFFRNQLTLDNVQIGGNVFQLGTMDSLLGYLSMVDEDVKLNGSLALANTLKVDKLTFTGSINGISSADFGYQWLLSETNQVKWMRETKMFSSNSNPFTDSKLKLCFKDFTAPQTVYTIRTDENVILNGHLNDIVDLVNHFGITQFKDQPILFKNSSFGWCTPKIPTYLVV